MKGKFKLFLVLALVMLLIMTTAGPAFAGSNTIDYVAMGDSGAAGVRALLGQQPGWEEGSDYGYTDNIARWLAFRGSLGNFNEDYAISGNTAAELAVMTSTKKAQKTLSRAELVTITIGANDLLGPLYAYYYSCVESGVPLDLNEAMAVVNGILANMPTLAPQISTDLITVLSNTLNAAPYAKVYVMGYYNPLPFTTDLGLELSPAVMAINQLIQDAIDYTEGMYGVTIEYVPTFEIINSFDGTTYTQGSSYAYGPLYNYPYFPFGYKYLYVNLFEPIADIHLTMRGYAKVAEAFIEAIKTDFGFAY